MTNEHDTDSTLPAAIVERMKAQDRTLTMLTPQIDRAMEQHAQGQFGADPTRHLPRTRRRAASLWGVGAAAAAAVAFVVIVVREPLPLAGNEPTASIPALLVPGEAASELAAPAALRRAVAGDYDGSGSVDVLDALRLSRDLAANPRFAANDTVESLMQRIVSLDGSVQ